MEAGFDDFLAKPVRFERVCEALACLLHVQFEYAQPLAATMAKDTPGSAVTFGLPETLRSELKAAAAVNNLTALNQRLDELEKLGPKANQLADQLRGLVRRFDLRGFTKMLEEFGA